MSRERIMAVFREWAESHHERGNYVCLDLFDHDDETGEPLPTVFFGLDGKFDMDDLASRIEALAKEAK